MIHSFRALLTCSLCLCFVAVAPTALSEQAPILTRTAASAGPVGAATVQDYALERSDRRLQAGLERMLRLQGLDRLTKESRLAVAVVDLTRPLQPRYASVNGDRMMYAASLPKIAILAGAFDALERGELEESPGLWKRMADMIRVSSNTAATWVLRKVGFERVARTVTSAKFGLYDEHGAGGLWVGKAYGRNSYWRRDPIANLSHGATARQTARFFTLMDRGLLISREASARMKELLGNPGIRHKFVRGLESRPGARIFRKSGTWRDYHADAALVERPDARYVIVGLVQDADGERILQRLAASVDDLVRGDPAPGPDIAR